MHLRRYEARIVVDQQLPYRARGRRLDVRSGCSGRPLFEASWHHFV